MTAIIYKNNTVYAYNNNYYVRVTHEENGLHITLIGEITNEFDEVDQIQVYEDGQLIINQRSDND